MKSKHNTLEHFNLAGEYIKARTEDAPDKTMAPQQLTLDQYVEMVRQFGNKCAITHIKPQPPRRQYDELDEILMRIDPAE